MLRPYTAIRTGTASLWRTVGANQRLAAEAPPAARRSVWPLPIVFGLAVWAGVALISCQSTSSVLPFPPSPDGDRPAAPPSSPADARPGNVVDLGPASIEAATADAEYATWEQCWTLGSDGGLRRREHTALRLHNSRPIRQYADPRVDYCVGEDELVIHGAQTILPSGETLPVPGYSFNVAAPDDVAGWPQYTAWQQRVICFSGVQNEAVLDLDYEVVTKPGALPWISADLQLQPEYPTSRRTASVTVPASAVLNFQIDGLTPAPSPTVEPAAGGKTYTWSFTDLPAYWPEAQSPLWPLAGARLRFTTCPSTTAWVAAYARAVQQSSQPDEAIRKFAEATVKEENDATQRLRKIAAKLRDSFNFVDSPKTMRSLQCRSAAEVFRSNYGNPLEAAALCAALLRSLGLDPQLAVAVDANAWSDADTCPPTDSAFAGVVVEVAGPQGPTRIHPRHGVIADPGVWGRRWLLRVGEDGSLHKTYLRARGEKEPSELEITGKLTLSPDGKADGHLRLRLTGAFYDPAKLEDAAAQKAAIEDFAGRILNGFKVNTYTITALSEESLQATLAVAAAEPLPALDQRRVLSFGEQPAFLKTIPLPLARSYRRTSVQLAGPVRETVDLTVDLPEGWHAVAAPAGKPSVQGSWGVIGQTFADNGKSVRWQRVISIGQNVLPPADLAAVRSAINDLRADRSHWLVVGGVDGG